VDISNDVYLARIAIVEAAAFMAAPHVRMRPRVFPDGNQWCCLYGDDLMVGVAGFGDTPEMACAAFDAAWSSEKPPVIAKPPYPFCRDPKGCAGKGYCPRDPACNN
jgi:hypothetical protein